MPPTLLLVRFLQIRREVSSLGWVHKLLFLILLTFAVIICHQVFQKAPGSWYLVLGLWTSTILAQLFRPDKTFVFLHLHKPNQAIFLEYAAFSLPFILPALFSPNWFCVPVYLFGLIPITFIRTTFSTQTRFAFLGRFLPQHAFEWIAGFRQYLLLLAPIYVLAIAFSWVKILPLALLWLFFGSLLGVYQLCEPLIMLRATSETPEQLIRLKVRQMLKMVLVICLPVMVLQTIFHPWLGLACLGFLLLQSCVLAFAITLKYSAYEPNKTQNSNMLLVAFAQISVVLPFFILLPIILLLRQYKRAKQNLNLYLPPC